MSTSAEPVNTTAQEQIASASRVWRVGLLAAVLASVANLIVYLIASALGISFNLLPAEIPAPPFALVAVLATSVGILAGTFVLTQMPRFSKRPITAFRNVAIVVLLLSLLQPLMLTTGLFPTPEPIGAATVLALGVMHVVAGAIAIILLTTRARA